MTDLATTAAKGAWVTLLAQGARFGMRFGSMIVLARLLTPSQFGIVAMATSILGVAEIIRDFGLSSAAIQARQISAAERTNLFWLNSLIGLICGVVAATSSHLIADIYGEPVVATVVLSLAWLLLVSGANTQFRAELSRELRFRALALTDVLAQVCSVVAAVTLAAIGAGIWAIVAQQIVLVVVTLVSNVLLCSWRPGFYVRGASVRRFLRFGGSVVGTQALGYVVNNVDNVAIGSVWGPAALGLYGRAYQLLLVPLEQLNAPMTNVVLPVLSRVQDDKEQFVRYVQRAQSVNCYVLATGLAFAAGLSSPLVAAIFGEQWSGITPIFAILAVGGVFRSLTQVIYWVFLATGKAADQLRLYLWTRPIMIGLMLAGLPWGPAGVASGHSLAFALYWIVSVNRAQTATGMDLAPIRWHALRTIMLVTLPVGLAAFLGTTLSSDNLVAGISGVALALASFCLVVTAVPPIRREFGVIIAILKRASSRGGVK